MKTTASSVNFWKIFHALASRPQGLLNGFTALDPTGLKGRSQGS